MDNAASLISVPMITLLIIGMATQLVDIAEDASDKTLLYAEDMTSSIDCAYLGQPLKDCSNELTETDFKQDLSQVEQELKEMQKSLENLKLEEAGNN